MKDEKDITEQVKSNHQKLVAELNELEDVMKEALEENEPFHTLEETIAQRKFSSDKSDK